MSGPVMIRARGLGKRYRIRRSTGRSSYGSLRESLATALTSLVNRKRGPRGEELWALRDVDLEVPQGEVLGIIGRNGAGKSTLLKILSRITEPTTGWAQVRGRVGSLLEIGTGFHPELTGRENIYLNGSILGMSREDIRRRFDEIVAFAGLERFLDTPVKHYSSGMYMRLAFSVAAHLEPEVLVVDEVLAVGDADFQRRCIGKMGQVAGAGRTVLFVSHDLVAIESLCHRCCLLQDGRIVADGPAPAVVENYLSSAARLGPQSLAARGDRMGDGPLRFTDIAIRSGSDLTGDRAQCGQPLELRLGFALASGSAQTVRLAIGIFAATGQCMLLLDNEMIGAKLGPLPPAGSLAARIDRLPLAPAQYLINIYCEVGGGLSDWIQHAADLIVEDGDFFGTGKLPPRSHGGVLIDFTLKLASIGPDRVYAGIP